MTHELRPPVDAEELGPINRRQLFEGYVADEILRTPEGFAVLIGDLNGLKEINDTYGHDEGDEYINTARDVLHAYVRRKDESRIEDIVIDGKAVHTAGDEFFVLARGVHSQKQVGRIIARLQGALDDHGVPMAMGGRVHRRGDTVKSLLVDADRAMYINKRIGLLLEHRVSALQVERLKANDQESRLLLGGIGRRAVVAYLEALDWYDEVRDSGQLGDYPELRSLSF